jgi:DHA1 family multidrug resistance protein-like MFS transporter
MSLVSQARSLGKFFLLFDNALVILGFFVVFPLISIRFVDQLGWAAMAVGLALGLRQLTQQGLGIFGGAIADRFGAKPMIITGMLLRAAGFATMALADSTWILICSCVLSGLGGTLFDPPRTALVINLIRPHERSRFLSFRLLGWRRTVCARRRIQRGLPARLPYLGGPCADATRHDASDAR